MRTTSKPTIEAFVDCHAHGIYDAKTGRYDFPWKGAVECFTCKRIFLCVEIEDKRTYPELADDGYCPCGSWVLPRTKQEEIEGQGAPVFSARPLCDACAALRVAPAPIEKKPITFLIPYRTIARYALTAAAIAVLMLMSRYC